MYSVDICMHTELELENTCTLYVSILKHWLIITTGQGPQLGELSSVATCIIIYMYTCIYNVCVKQEK